MNRLILISDSHLICTVILTGKLFLTSRMKLKPDGPALKTGTVKKAGGGITNGGRKGSPSFRLKAGESKILAEASGTSGMIRRIWLTIDERTPEMLRGVKIEMYWDGASDPAVSAPLGDFFNHGLGQMSVFENALFSSPEGRSFNCNHSNAI